MKTRTSSFWIPGLVLLVAWSPGGLAQDEIDLSSAWTRDSTPFLTPVSAVTNALPPTTHVPPKIRLSPWTAEVVKLAQVGIEDNVMLSFIDNSGMFNLGAEQIIYLADLGVSSEVISEMLRHDAEVIAGVRRLTIASVPPPDTSMQITFTTSSSASARASVQPVTASTPPAIVNSQLSAVANQKSFLEADHGVTDSGQTVLEFAMMDESKPARPEALSEKRQASEGKKGLYPVREPHPVPLTVPIIFVQTAERIPDILVIERLR